MATREDIYAALRNADAAGDTQSVQKLAAYLQTMEQPEVKQEPKEGGLLSKLKSEVSSIPGLVGNVAAGAVRGAGSIGATIVDAARSAAAPVLASVPQEMRPQVTQGLATAPKGKELRGSMDAALQEMGANPDSLAYQGGKIGAEIAGTLGAGGGAAKLLPAGPIANAIASGGFSTGMAPGVANWATRVAGGAANGAATAGLVDPKYAGAGAVMGGALPVVAGGAGYVGDAISRSMEGGSKRLMQSAIKPTIKQLHTGDAEVAVNTLLQRGINPNEAGVNKLRALIDDLDNQITSKIANSTATVDKAAVLNRLAQTQKGFGAQVSPTKDLQAIQAVGDDFLAHPNFPLPQTQIPVQAAQDMKRATYDVLKKKYGQMGGAETEAQKALARGLKEEIATAVPGVQGINEELSKLITTLNVAERRALMEVNKNPMGLAALAQSPVSWAMFMADKSAAFKAIAARMLNGAAGGTGNAVNLLGNSAANPIVRNALVRPLAATEASP